MSKKLVGNRSVGDLDFVAGQVISDEEFAASGLEASDVVESGEAPVVATAPAEETPAAPVDADAEIDAGASAGANEQKNDEKPSDTVEGGDQGGASFALASEGDETPTVEYTLTEEDIAAHPDLTEKGHKAGDLVRVPAPATEAPAA